MNMSIYDKRRTFKLYSDGKNYILSSQHIENEKLLVKVTANDTKLYLNKITDEEFQSIQAKSSRPFVNLIDSYGCIGLFKPPCNRDYRDVDEHYLIFIKDAQSINSIGKSDVLRISDVYIVYLNCLNPDEDLVQFNNNLNSNSSYFVEIRKFLSSGYFYFTYSTDFASKYDLTLNSQLRSLNEKQIGQSDNRFLWNSSLLTPLRRLGVDLCKWLTTIICGYVDIRKVIVGHEAYKACLISRLSSERAGTRFKCRGTNDYGHCANYVETEQFIMNEPMDRINSLVQIRGSIPLFWEQTGYQVGTHKIKITRGIEACYTAFQRHFKFIIKNFYDKVVVLNLLGRKGDEAILSDSYKRLFDSCDLKDNLNFVNFDYHQELKANRQALSLYLLPKLNAFFNAPTTSLNLFFDSKTKTLQNFVIRTNCLDCLDRTNATQMFIGMSLLRNQLKHFDLANTNDKDLNKFREVFTSMWVNNGDNLSKIYAGTGAIQGKSVTQDIGRSLSRAIQNNFLDQTKQDIIETFLYGSALIKGPDLAERARILLTSACLQLPSYLLSDMVGRYKEFCDTQTCNIVVGTWNINGGLNDLHMSKLSLDEWLCEGPSEYVGSNADQVDIYAVGFQEIVDLSAQNIVNASDENALIWYNKIYKFLSTKSDYVPVTNEPLQMVGVSLLLFVHKKHVSSIRDVAVSRMKTGLGGTTGNKGGVSMRFTYYNSSICFVCSHFAAHQNQIKQRNEDFSLIYENSEFPQSRDIKSHDYVIWFGDLNYRIDMPNERVRSLINNCDWSTLHQCDQLLLQRQEGNVFQEFNEAPLYFPPTYKYNMFEDTYDRSEKCRVPAWTDRILWRRRPITKAEKNDKNFNVGKCLYYDRANIQLSDHRPVCALLQLEVNKVVPKRLFHVFEQLMHKKGPFQCTIRVTIIGGVLNRALQNSIIELFVKSKEKFVYREFNGCLYLTYYIFQEAIEACLKFDNHQMFDYNCYLSCKLDNDNYQELAQQEIRSLMHAHLPIFDENMMDKHDENLLGDCLYDEQSFIKVPSQIHTNLSFSKNLHSISKIASQNYLLDIDHPSLDTSNSHNFYKSLSTTSLPVQVDTSRSEYRSTSQVAATCFHLFDMPNEDFEKYTITSTSSAQSLPRRPPPPPSSANKPQSEQPLVEINTALLEDSLLDIVETVLPSRSPPPPELNTNSNTVRFTKQSASQLIDIYEPVQLAPPPPPPLPPKPQPRTKLQKQSDLYLLGEPGSPAPPPLPAPPSLTLTKPTGSFATLTTTDFDLLGDPGSPPPTPPPH